MKTRIISSVVAILIAIGGLCLSGTGFLNIIIALLAVMILHEAYNGFNIKNSALKYYGWLWAVLPIAADYFTWAVNQPDTSVKQKWGDIAAQTQTIVTILIPAFMFLAFIRSHKTTDYREPLIVFSLAFMVGYSMRIFISLRNQFELTNERVFMFLLVMFGAWFADSGAYFVGTALGKHKLCPEISPKKTVEGFIGGLVTNMVIFPIAAIIFVKFFYNADTSSFSAGYFSKEADNGFFSTKAYISHFAVLGLICAAVGALGDLAASALKRQLGIKDWGKIMPGHGGVIDRFDSLLFILPVFMFYTELFLI